jgi:PAS domain S-box-containing protein
MAYSVRKTAWAAFLAAVILLGVMAALAYQATSLLVRSERWVEHTREVQQALEDLCSNSVSANNARRGYIITGDAIQVQTFSNAAQKIPDNLARLRQLTADNPARQQEINHLEALLNQHIGAMRDSINLRRSGKLDAPQQIEATRQSAVLSTQIRSLVTAMENQETGLLQQREVTANHVYQHTQLVIAVTFVVALCLLAAEFWLLNLQFSRRERSEQLAHQSRELVNVFFSSSTVGFAILDKDLRYRRVNAVLARMAGMQSEDFLGKSVPEVFGDSALLSESLYQGLLQEGQPILDREMSGEARDKPGEKRHWLVNYFPIRDNQKEIKQIGVIAVDVTARRNAERAIRRLSARLISLQDQERRRIARELHDGLGQYLVALKLTIERLRHPEANGEASVFAQCGDLLEKAIAETRTLSYLLHPPLLDEAGFCSAAGWFVDGFSQRSGIPVNLSIPPDFPRFSNAVELALFRTLQEGLTNIHRHSQSTSAEIHLQLDAENVVLEVQDHGRGIPGPIMAQLQNGETQSGVGLAGMRERVRELGGQFEIQANDPGTLIRVTLPQGFPPERETTVRETGTGKAPAA